MERTDFATSQGTIPLWAPPGAFRSAKPFVLIITGAWASAEEMIRAPDVLAPAWDAAVMRLPGNGAPWLRDTSISSWAAAVDELIGAALAGRVVVPLGLSIGGLVALSLRAPEVRAIAAVEPPLVMSKLWPMRDDLLARWRDTAEFRGFLDCVFGVTGPAGAEERTWFHLFEGAAPVDVILGEVPLMPPRPLPRFPSFVDTPERQWLAQRPRVRTHVVPGVGHNIHAFEPHPLLEALAMAQADALAAARSA